MSPANQSIGITDHDSDLPLSLLHRRFEGVTNSQREAWRPLLRAGGVDVMSLSVPSPTTPCACRKGRCAAQCTWSMRSPKRSAPCRHVPGPVPGSGHAGGASCDAHCGVGAGAADTVDSADTTFGGFRTKDPQDFLGPTAGFPETPGSAIRALQLHATGRLSWT
jgi:hypothetical protein